MIHSEPLQLLDYLHAVRRRWRLIVLTTLVATGAALAVSLSGDNQYEATAELLLREQEPINSLLQPNASFGSQDPERELNTSVELIKVGAVALAARSELGIRRDAEKLVEQISTETSTSSNIVTLKARDRVPRLAADIANAFAGAYARYRLGLARTRYEQAARLASAQLKALSKTDRASDEGRGLQARRRELEIAAALQTGGVQVVRRATPPTEAAQPRPRLAAVLGLGLGLLLGVGIALTHALFDRRLQDEEMIQSFTGLPILAAIPRPSRSVGGIKDNGQSEAYGLLAANLRFSALIGDRNVLMVTSSSPGEGKTSVTLGLARALAQLGLRVIALETDLRRPAFSKYLSFPPSPGLASVLSGSSHLAQELVWLKIADLAPAAGNKRWAGRFAVLPAGALPPDPQRVLATPAMEEVVRTARMLADIVLIDTSPIGTVNDPAALCGAAGARVVDSIALVVRLNGTSQEAARRAMRVLHSLDVSLAGAVVTGAEPSPTYGYYPAAAPELEPTAVEDQHG